MLSGVLATAIRSGLLITSRSNSEQIERITEKLDNDRKLYDTVFGNITDRNSEMILANHQLIIDSDIDYDPCYTYLLGNPAFDVGLLSSQYKTLTDKSYSNDNKGLSLRLTIDDHLQKLAYRLSQDRRKSIAIMEKDSGKVLALAGAYNEPFSLCHVTNEMLEQYSVAEQPVWSPEYMNNYHAGSVMKIFTAAVGCETGWGDFTVEDTGTVYFNGRSISNAYDTRPKTETMESAFVNSSNVYFSSLAVAIGADSLKTYIDRFLLNTDIRTDFGLLVNQSELKKRTTDFSIASFGYGQGGRYSVVALCLMVQGALTGRIFRPHVLDGTFYYDTQGEEVTVSETEDEILSDNIVSPETGRKVESMMKAAASANGLPEHTGIKTGTAEIYDNGHNYNRAAMIGIYDKYIIAVSELSEPESTLYGISQKNTMQQIFAVLAQY